MPFNYISTINMDQSTYRKTNWKKNSTNLLLIFLIPQAWFFLHSALVPENRLSTPTHTTLKNPLETKSSPNTDWDATAGPPSNVFWQRLRKWDTYYLACAYQYRFVYIHQLIDVAKTSPYSGPNQMQAKVALPNVKETFKWALVHSWWLKNFR